MTTLLIIESPGKRKKLSSILGPGYQVMASFGHVRDLPKNETGVAAPDYKPKYVLGDGKSKKTIAELRRAASSADRVLLATDPDREGEAIAWHVAEALRLDDRQRVTYQSVTEKAVLAAVGNPRPLDMALVHAQEARRVLDRLVGYEVSPALGVATKQSLSAGRVQSPAVRLVVDREVAIRQFVSTTHYGAVLHFDGQSAWKAEWDSSPFLAEDAEYLLDPALAQQAAAVRAVVVRSCEDSVAEKNPPPPFTTSSMQQRAQTVLKLKPKQTMQLAQKLYEQGVISYMRTDSPNLSNEGFEDLLTYAASQDISLVGSRRTWKAKGGSQEAHEAIRPTHFEDAQAGETADEQALYRLIWQQAVASQMPPARYAVRKAVLESAEPINGSRTARYVATGRTLQEAGWKALAPRGDDEGEAANPVPALREGQELSADDGELLTKQTKPPKRYTLATLVRALEKHEIGRPSTYASILDNISRRGYITEDKKGFLAATVTGEAVVNALVGTCTFIDLDYTKALEAALDDVAQGAKSYRDVVGDAHAILTREIKSLAPELPGGDEQHECPECGSAMRYRVGKRGPFWGCSGYPKCRVTLPDDDGKPGEQTQQDGDTHPCPSCGKSMYRRDGKRGSFWGCSGYPKCKTTLPDEDGQPGERQANDNAPSEAQIRFAQQVAERNDLPLPDDVLESRSACSAWLDEHVQSSGTGRGKSKTRRRKA